MFNMNGAKYNEAWGLTPKQFVDATLFRMLQNVFHMIDIPFLIMEQNIVIEEMLPREIVK